MTLTVNPLKISAVFSWKIRRHAKMRKRFRLLFHATDFQSLMYPGFNFCRILGMFPYKINALTFETSKPHYVLSTVVTCICCVLIPIFIHDIVISKTIDFGDASRNFEMVGFYIFSGFVVIATHVLSGPRMRLFQTILEITFSLKLPSETYQKLSGLIHIKDILGTILMVVQVCLYFSKSHIVQSTYPNVLILLFTMYLSILKLQMEMQHINCVCVLKACFERLNDYLVHMKKIVEHDKQHAPRLICRTQKNQFLLLELRTLKKQHLIISNTVQMLNIIFSIQILITIVITYSDITFELYSYVVRWQDGISISLDWQFVDVLLASMTLYIMKIALLVWACETGKNQAQEVGTTIHDILNNTSDKQIKHEVKKTRFIFF